jgi:hypothetical protein
MELVRIAVGLFTPCYQFEFWDDCTETVCALIYELNTWFPICDIKIYV